MATIPLGDIVISNHLFLVIDDYKLGEKHRQVIVLYLQVATIR